MAAEKYVVRVENVVRRKSFPTPSDAASSPCPKAFEKDSWLEKGQESNPIRRKGNL